MPTTVVFYTSGHGFGHATRDIEVINRIFECRPGARVVVRTAVPASFFGLSLRGPAEVMTVEADTGVAQIDSLRLDEDETARQAARFYESFRQQVRSEADALRRLSASIVVADAPPLAFAAADEAGIPAVALANFTWDWIYEGYPEFERLAPGVLEIVREAYGTATCALRLPLAGGFGPMAGRTIDIPFIARRSIYSREEARRRAGLAGEGRPVVLASFGAFGADLPYQEIALRNDLLLLTDDFDRRGLRYEDLVRAADVVVTKPGYGIVSECIANGAAIVYTSRGRFREYDVIVAALPGLLRSEYISPDALRAGRWRQAVDAVLEKPAPAAQKLSGAARAADEILARA